MKKGKKQKRKVTIFGVIGICLIINSSCKKDLSADSSAIETSATTSAASKLQTAAVSNNSSVYTVTLSGLRSDGGYAYKISYPLAVSGDDNSSPTNSNLRLFENGKEIGPAHSVHDDIRNLGKGRFSHWGTSLIFSASDNSNPANNGRSYTFTLDGSVPSSTGNASNGTSTTQLPTNANAGLLGYATVNGMTTGGAGGATVVVSNIAQLKTALGDDAPKIVYISGALKGSGNEYIYVKSNKSIIGKSGASLEGINLYMFTVSNIIVQDLRFKNYVNDAALMIKMSTHHIWVDHCEFSTDRTHGWDYWGKDISITREADYVTVSWCKFHDTNLSVLISGGIQGHESDKGKLHVTMHHNFWYNVSEREPTMNYGSVHLFNNYHLNNSSYCLGARAGGIVRTDNEYFSGCHKPITTNLDGDPPGYFSGISTNIYNNCGSNDITTTISTWLPSYTYQSALNVAADVPTLVTQGSGPRSIN